jgi:5-methylcytosine-specific restriction endonuclease McrA
MKKSNNWNEFSHLKLRETIAKKMEAKTFDEVSYGTKRVRVITEQDNKCNRCGIDSWMGEDLPLEIDHINGNNQDNSRENLEALCPNCHSLTKTWRGRNRSDKKVSDSELLEHLKSAPNIRQGLLNAGLAGKGGNYKRAKKLLGS